MIVNTLSYISVNLHHLLYYWQFSFFLYIWC